MRIVAGLFAGKELVSPTDQRVRPTAEPVRAAMLDALTPYLAGARVLDLFAGTGALGIEAISRGAAAADFVEFRPASLHALRANLAAFRLRNRTRVFKRDAMLHIATLPADACDITFADPPYDFRVLERLVMVWRERGFSRHLAVEHARDYRVPPGALRRTLQDTSITIYHR